MSGSVVPDVGLSAAMTYAVGQTVESVSMMLNVLTLRHTVAGVEELRHIQNTLRKVADDLPVDRSRAATLTEADRKCLHIVQCATIRALTDLLPDAKSMSGSDLKLFSDAYAAAQTAVSQGE